MKNKNALLKERINAIIRMILIRFFVCVTAIQECQMKVKITNNYQ